MRGLEELRGLEIGSVIAGKYRVDRVLDKGSMGVVLAATHLDLGELRAIKLLQAATAADPELYGRFLQEARIVARLKSEHAVRVYELGRLETGLPYMVMEFLAGRDLRTVRKQRGTLPLREATLYMIQACDVLAEAHALGLVHRDIKPANLFLTHTPRGKPCIKLLDFGVSKASETTLFGGSEMRTSTGQMIGTPHYMPPEQMRGQRDVDARADIWAVGSVLYLLITGRYPMHARSVQAVSLVLGGKYVPPPPSEVRKDLPPEIDPVIMRCLERDRNKRYANVAELVTALSPFAPVAAQPLVKRIQRIFGGSVREPAAPGSMRESAAPGSMQESVAPGSMRESAAPGSVQESAMSGSARGGAGSVRPGVDGVVAGVSVTTMFPGRSSSSPPGATLEALAGMGQGAEEPVGRSSSVQPVSSRSRDAHPTDGTTPAPWEVEIAAPLEATPGLVEATESSRVAGDIDVRPAVTRSPAPVAASSSSAVEGPVDVRRTEAAPRTAPAKGVSQGDDATPVDSSLSIMTLAPRSRRWFPVLGVTLAVAAVSAGIVMVLAVEQGLFAPSSSAPVPEARPTGAVVRHEQEPPANLALAAAPTAAPALPPAVPAPAESSTSLAASSEPPAAPRATPLPAPGAGMAVAAQPPAAPRAAPLLPVPDAGVAVTAQPPAVPRAAPLPQAPDAGVAVAAQPPAAPNAAPLPPSPNAAPLPPSPDAGVAIVDQPPAAPLPPSPDAGVAVVDRPRVAPAPSASGGAPAERVPSAQEEEGGPVTSSPQ